MFILVKLFAKYDIQQLKNEAEYLMKNQTPSEIFIILHMMRKPNSIIVLLFIQNNS